MRNLVFGFFAVLAIAATSCKPSVTEQRLQKIDSLIVVIDSCAGALEKIEYNKVVEYHNNAESQLDFIAKHYLDTMSAELSIFLSDYRADRKSLGRLKKSYDDQLNEIEYSKKQLNDLRSVVEQKKLTDEEYAEFYGMENESVFMAKKMVENMKYWYATSKDHYEKANPRVTAIVDSLKANGYR